MSQQIPEMATVRYVLLALLARSPSTGHQLAQRLQDPVGYFWSAPHSQIYPQLAALTEDGLVEFAVESAGEIRPRKRYRVTRAGNSALRRWLVSKPQQRPPHDELVMRAYAIAVADRVAAAQLFAESADRHRAKLAEYRRFAREIRAEFGPAADDPGSFAFGNWATVQAGICEERARIRWCEWMAASLTTGSAAAAPSRP